MRLKASSGNLLHSAQDLNKDPKLPYEDNTYDVRFVGLLVFCFIIIIK